MSGRAIPAKLSRRLQETMQLTTEHFRLLLRAARAAVILGDRIISRVKFGVRRKA